MVDIKVPVLPESVADASIANWHKSVGDLVHADENLVDIETDKIVLEVVAPSSGKITSIIKNIGDQVFAEEVIAQLEEMDISKEQKAQTGSSLSGNSSDSIGSVNLKESKSEVVEKVVNSEPEAPLGAVSGGAILGPSARRHRVVSGVYSINSRVETREKVSRLRSKVAERLLSATQDTAMLTTFNEVNMQAVMDIRSKYKDRFEKKHGLRLGFMSFFTKAVALSLQKFPKVNAYLDNDEILYHSYCDIGIAVASPRGLVVPILRNVENMGFADIEGSIFEFGQRAKEGKLSLEDMSGGTFTISNGGVFGSLLSTPILNPPQTAILGMHKIEKRPIVEDDAVVIRPMMYLALSYDHRLIDGAESVKFLVMIKELLEDPSQMLLDL